MACPTKYKISQVISNDIRKLNMQEWPGMKVRDLVKLIESDGWKHVRTTGSHRIFKHFSKPRLVTIAGKPGDDVPLGTLKAILKDAQVTQE